MDFLVQIKILSIASKVQKRALMFQNLIFFFTKRAIVCILEGFVKSHLKPIVTIPNASFSKISSKTPFIDDFIFIVGSRNSYWTFYV